VPELPEVETARRIVETELVGLKVKSVVVRLPKLFRFSELQPPDQLIGMTITAARRRAKLLVIDFSRDVSLMIHFKLTGQLAVHRRDGQRYTAGHPVPAPDASYPQKSTHVELHFDDGTLLFLSDLRQFSWFRLMPTAEVPKVIDSFKFGPEGLGPDRIAPPALINALAKRSIAVKLALLDQRVVAGVGNIYADEAIHRARIHPAQPANTLTSRQTSRLCAAIEWALQNGVEQGGAKIIHQRAYPVGGFPAVHGREGLPCPDCGKAVRKIIIGGRGTYLCSKCQRSKAKPPGKKVSLDTTAMAESRTLA
jgi:formamidopyrimidine-DNA glycosylase